MKTTAILFVAFGLVASTLAQSVRIVYYSDNSCQKMYGSTFQAVAHPWTSNMQACTQYEASPNAIATWMKPVSVSVAEEKISFEVWGENQCTVKILLGTYPRLLSYTYGQCLNDASDSKLPAGAGSMIVTYSSASVASAAISFAVAVIAFVSL